MASPVSPAREKLSDIPTVLDDSIQIISAEPDPPRPNPLKWLRWALPLLPWTWFGVRDLFPSMDLVAVGLPVITLGAGVIGLAGLMVRRSIPWLLLLVSLAAFFIIAVQGPFRSTDGAAPNESIRVASVNTGLYWFSDNDVGFVVFEEEIDLVIGVELSESHDVELRSRFDSAVSDIIPIERQQQNQELLQPEGGTYRRNGLPSIGVYSDLPIIELEDPIADVIDGGLPGFRLQVTTDTGDMIVYALHIPRPIDGDGPYEVSASEHLAISEAVAEAVSEETLPVMVIGDLNAIDRGQAYRTLTTGLEDGIRHAGAAGPTTDRPFPESLLLARVDHLLMSPGLCTGNADRLETRFTDHQILVADIGPCPETLNG